MTARPEERSVGAAVLAVMALAALVGAWALPWFEFDYSSGRQTPPDGAYNDGEDGITRHHGTYDARSWSGDVEPDGELAGRLALWLPACLGVATLALLLVALGEVPAVHRVIHRRVGLALVGVALAAIAAAALMAWAWMPDSMAEHRVDSQFAARLDDPPGELHEDGGYTSSNLLWGWYLLAASAIPAIGAGLFKFQAGQVDLEVVAAGMLRSREDA